MAPATSLNSDDYYKNEPITPLYLVDSEQDGRVLAGYVVFNYQGEDLNLTGVDVEINKSLIHNTNYSPIISEIINSDEQIVLIGDSLFGAYLEQESIDAASRANNVLADLLMGMTHRQVLNCGFGGCSMAHRHQNPNYDNDYDAFSFFDVMKTLVTQDYSDMENVKPVIYKQYKKQISYLKNIDFTKKVTFLLAIWVMMLPLILTPRLETCGIMESLKKIGTLVLI